MNINELVDEETPVTHQWDGRLFHTTSSADNWPGAISDGMVTACESCGVVPGLVDYLVTNKGWDRVVPREWRASVVCLGCFDEMASAAGVMTEDVLVSCQLTLSGVTVGMVAAWSHRRIEDPQ